MPSPSETASPDNGLLARLFAAIPLPFFIVDASGHVLEANAEAISLTGGDVRGGVGSPVLGVLGAARVERDQLRPWSSWPALLADLERGGRITCRFVLPDGTTRSGYLVGTSFPYAGQTLTLIAVLYDRGETVVTEPPLWSLTDPVTHLPNRLFLARHQSIWNRQAGTILLLDVDEFKMVNDLYGHPEGDRLLAVVSRELSHSTPGDGYVVRYGGDEFLAWAPGTDPTWAQDASTALHHRLTDAASVEALPVVPSVSCGVAGYAAGHLQEGLQSAEEELYTRKGTLLKTLHGSLLVTRTRQVALLEPSDEENDDPGHLASQVGPDFDEVLHQSMRQAQEDARRFVGWVGVQAGTAVVEVGAGAGRLAVEGGLQDAVGREGALLLTDPSELQMHRARRRLGAQGTWVRFLVAPAERLPLASARVDLTLGAWFLHLCRATEAVCELRRVTRPGGRIALDVVVDGRWPPAWHDILTPLRDVLSEHQLPFGISGHRQGEIPALCETHGLHVTRVLVHDAALTFYDPEVAWRFLVQGGHLSLLSRGLPADVRRLAWEGVRTRLRAVFAQASPDDLTVAGGVEYVEARRV